MLKVGDQVRIKELTKQELRIFFFLTENTLQLLEKEFFTIKKIGDGYLYQLEGIQNIQLVDITFSREDFEEEEIFFFEKNTACNCPLSNILAKGCKIHI